MKRFKNILYYADHDKKDMLERAFSLAQSNQAVLTIMDVIETAEIAEDVISLYGIDLNNLLCQQRLKDLEALIKPYQKENLLIKTKVVIGKPFIELIRKVQCDNHDLLMKTAQPQEGLVDRIFGSSDMHILRKCPCPVWIDGAESSRHYKTILAAVDPMDDACEDLNTLIMDLATSLADKESAQLHIVHAWSLQGESMLQSPRGGLSKAELHNLLNSTQLRHSKKLDQLLHKYNLNSNNEKVSLVKSEAASAISHKADQINADLIVMGTIGRTGIPGLFIGNTAEDVLNSTNASVLAVKPQGFVSPVSLPKNCKYD